MPATITKSTDFKEQVFYIGIEVHKKSWTLPPVFSTTTRSVL